MIISNISSQPLFSLYQGLYHDLRIDATFIYSPRFQRQSGQWDLKQKQEFINSLLYSVIPLTQPILLGMIIGDDKLLLLDGKQRLTTTLEFVDLKFNINSLDKSISFSDLDHSEQRKLRNTIIPTITLNNIKDYDQAYEIFLKANSGVPLTPFQKQKGHKDLSKFCDLINNNKNIHEILHTLKIIPKVDKFNNLNKYEKLSELVVSLLCLHEDRTKYKDTSTYAGQWSFHKKELDVISSKKLDESYWSNLNTFIKTNLNGIDKLSSDPSRRMFLYTLLSLDKSKLVNKTSELNEALNNNRFDYIEIRNDIGKLNDAASRAALFKRTNEFIDILNSSSRRRFSNNEKIIKLEEQEGKCGHCNEKIPSIEFSQGDHIVPYSVGGTTTEDNLMILCEFCNKSKGNV